MAITISKNYLTVNPNNTGDRGRNGVKEDYKHIAIHYVGACDWKTGFESTAINNCIYYRDQNPGASANYYVDSTGIVQTSVDPLGSRYAWHIGIGKSKTAKYCLDPEGIEITNLNTLGVEICVCKKNTSSRKASDTDWYFDPRTYSNAVEFVKWLMATYNIDINHVYRHYDCNTIHKLCPRPFVGADIMDYYGKTGDVLWNEFKAQLTQASPSVKECCQLYQVYSSDGFLNLRREPKNSGKIAIAMPTGTYFLVKKMRADGWYYGNVVIHGCYFEGWCYSKYLRYVNPQCKRVVNSPDGTLNIRALPNVRGKLLGTMKNGDEFFDITKANAYFSYIWFGNYIGYSDTTDNYSYKK